MELFVLLPLALPAWAVARSVRTRRIQKQQPERFQKLECRMDSLAMALEKAIAELCPRRPPDAAGPATSPALASGTTPARGAAARVGADDSRAAIGAERNAGPALQARAYDCPTIPGCRSPGPAGSFNSPRAGWSGSAPSLLRPAAFSWSVTRSSEAGLDQMSASRWFEAEMHRLRGRCLSADRQSACGADEASLQRAIDAAQKQEARWWELRAATDLARLWNQRASGGKPAMCSRPCIAGSPKASIVPT
jgi:hypothetical protein